MVSIAPPFGLLPVEKVQRAFQVAAMLDALVEADPDYRYFRYASNWFQGAALGQLDDGCGNNMFAIFLGHDSGLLKGFDHESSLSPFPYEREETWPGIFDEVPDSFRAALANLNDGEVLPLDTTFCIWRTELEDAWKQGVIVLPPGVTDDGFGDLLSLIPLDADTYVSWAAGYYEREIPIESVVSLYEGASLTASLLTSFDADDRRARIFVEASAIGWPVS
jgi:hypothetical protein